MTASVQKNKNARKLEELIKNIKVAMLVTIGEDKELHSCPMLTPEEGFDGDLWFFTKKSSLQAHNIGREPHVNVVYASPKEHLYVSVVGHATAVDDPRKIQELWSSSYMAWFEGGSTDPEIVLIRVEVENVEYWDSSSPTAVRLATPSAAELRV